MLLAAATLAVYWELIVRGFVLLSFDAFVFFYPLMARRDARLRAGELPLWEPGYFLGAPFLANPQTGVFYPPNWLTLFLDPPRAYAWQAFGHSLLLALGVFLVARRVLGLSVPGGLAAGLIGGLGGYGQSLVGHVNQLQGAAWLPIALLLADRALLTRSGRPVAVLGVVLALQLLAGHAQQSYLSLALIGVWLLARALLLGSRPQVVRAVFLLALAGAIAGMLSAPQLLLTQEATSQGIRAGGMTYREVVAFSLPPWMLPLSLLPVLTSDHQPGSEWQGYVGVSGLLLAGVGLLAGRPRALALLLGGVALAAFLLALGQFGPLYPLLYQIVPGLGLFRVPARWLFVYSFALALLAGLGLDALRAVDRRLLVRLALLGGALALPLALYGLVAREYPLRLPGPTALVAWVALAAAAVALLLLGRWRPRLAAPVLTGLLAAELLVASWPLEVNRAGPPEAYRSMRPTQAHLLAQLAGAGVGPHRTLAITDSGFDPGDLALLRSQVAGLLDAERVEDWVAAIKHKDALTPNLGLVFGIPSVDGYDGGVLPLRSYVALKELFPLRAANLADGRLGIQLERLPPVELLSWLGVGWIVMDRHRDVWVEGVYYDLAVQTTIAPGHAIVLSGVSPSARASTVGLIAWPASSSTGGAVALEFEAVGADGSVRRASVPRQVLADAAPGSRSPVLVPLGAGAPVARVTVRVPAGGAAITLGAVTLIDEPGQTDWPVPAAPGLRFTALGDVKVYRNDAVRPRAFLVHGVRPAPDDAAAVSLLRDDLDTSAMAAVAGACCGWPVNPPGPPEPGEVIEVVSHTPERVELRARLTRAGAVVLTDADYPGWSSTANGASVPIHRANGGLRALLLEPGEYAIVFTYSPRSLPIGVGLLVLGLVAVVWLLLSPSHGWAPYHRGA